MIKNDRLVKVACKALTPKGDFTSYPFGDYEIQDDDMIPILYEQENTFDFKSPIILVTEKFLSNVVLEKTKVSKSIIQFGSDVMPGTLTKTGIDLNGDGQFEVLMYDENVEDHATDEGDEDYGYTASIIALYFRDRWYRTSFWQEGQDGIEGF